MTDIRHELKTSSELRLIPVVIALVLLLPLPNVPSLTGAVLVVLPILPVLRRSGAPRSLRVIWWGSCTCSVLSLLAPWTVGHAMPTGRYALLPIAIGSSVVVLHWCCERLGGARAILLALPAPALFDLTTRDEYGNLFKYAIGIWLVIAIMILIDKRPLLVRGTAIAGLAATAAFFDTRHIVGLLAIVALWELLTWTRMAGLPKLLVFLTLGVGGVLTGARLALAGFFGERIEQTTFVQFEWTSGILPAARPELRGNLNLVSHDLIRLGAEESLTPEQAATVQASFASVGRNPYASIVTDYYIGGLELHSGLADLWLHLGTIGLVAGLALFAWTCVGMTRIVASGQRAVLGAAAMLAGSRLLWDLLFSPISDSRLWAVYISVLLLAIASVRDAPTGADR